MVVAEGYDKAGVGGCEQGADTLHAEFGFLKRITRITHPIDALLVWMSTVFNIHE